MKEIFTEIEIHAPASRIWGHLLDFDRFKDWNPFIREVRGGTTPGERLKVGVRLPSGIALTFRPRILKIEAERELRWIDRTALPGILEGEHSFVLERLGDDRVRFVHRECFRGLVAVLFGELLDRQIRPGFEVMNRTLKEVAERAGAAGI
ncbi:MAG: hypothetical protein A2Z17_05125 [Gammaproteobacteria bacterium RBG_16_66_13]|nr:MAG: hypothetical protein A2Z17_05125 [Gammaproteobacteria bacterium RBG_16_66_13]